MFGIAVLAAVRYPERHYQLVRTIGALCSGTGILVAYFAPPDVALPLLALLQLGMFVLLWIYYQKRRHSGAVDAPAGDPAVVAAVAPDVAPDRSGN